MIEAAQVLVGFILTVAVFSYLWGDNPVYRAIVHLLVGVSAAYASLVVMSQVIIPTIQQLDGGDFSEALWAIPIVLVVLLFLKLVPQVASLGNGAVALMIATGSAVALTGAVSGTILPQVTAVEGTVAGIVSALLTITVLFHFQMTRERIAANDRPWLRIPAWQQTVQSMGRGVVMLTLGAVFASLINTGVLLFVGHLGSLIDGLGMIFQ